MQAQRSCGPACRLGASLSGWGEKLVGSAVLAVLTSFSGRLPVLELCLAPNAALGQATTEPVHPEWDCTRKVTTKSSYRVTEVQVVDPHGITYLPRLYFAGLTAAYMRRMVRKAVNV